MSFTWFNEKPKEVVVTLASGHITLNKQGSLFFEHAYNVLLGVDHQSHRVAIKPLDKDESMSQLYPDNKKYKITVRASYARITNKAFMEEISSFTGINLEETPMKFPATWDEKDQMLVIDLKGGTNT